jgi:REP element-mobilizing transposase RayT
VTLRLADALPGSVMEAWHQDIDRRVNMLSGMKGRALESAEERQVVRRTLGKIDRCLDSGRGGCLLSDERAAGLVESVLWHGDGERYRLHAWSVMPNHVHALVTPLKPACVDDVVQEWKHESTRRVNQELRRVGGLWHPNVIDYEVEARSDFVRLRCTIASNPVQSGLNEWPFAGEESRLAHETPFRELAAV